MAQTNDGITLPLRIFQWPMCSLVNAIIRLSEPDFLYLVSRKLYDYERYLSVNNAITGYGWEEEKIPNADKHDFYAGDSLAEDIFLKLAGTKIFVKRNENDDDSTSDKVTVHKYYNQALRIWKVIAVARPRPKFIVNMSDLNTRIIAELIALDNDEGGTDDDNNTGISGKGHYSQYILKRAVSRIFENITSPKLCHLSIMKNLEVVLVP